MGLSQSHRRYAVGYGLAPNKAATIIKPSLVDHAKSHGIDLIQIDTTKPLIEQGPFDCVIHKLYDDDWKKQLADFSSKNPTVPVIDQPEAIERLHNRVTMLEAVAALKPSPTEETVGVPKQIVVDDLESLSDPDLGLIFPVVAKSLLANGTVKSHNMSLVFNAKGLVGLNTPVVLQEFVSHGGVVFKVYVAGEIVRCVTRESLPDVSEEEGAALGDSLLFSQISNLKSQEQKQGEEEEEEKHIEMPPVEFVKDVADGLRKALKLNLFNFDMIRDSRDRKRYFVIDINYFPGYAKIPEYETIVTDFLLGIVVPGKGSDGAED